MNKTIVFVTLLFSAVNSFSNNSLPSDLTQSLGKLGIPATAVSLYAKNLSTDKLLFEFNSNRKKNPASVMKLVTTLGALEILGPAYRWKTEVYVNGKISGTTLEGDLIIKGYGDPNLNLESFWVLLNKIQSKGVKNITGNVILDRSFFKLRYHDPSNFDGRPHRPYNLGPDALMINFRAVQINFVPNKNKRKIDIYSVPHFDEIKFVNNLKFTNKPCWNWPDSPKIQNKQIIFSGTFSSKCGEKQRFYSILTSDQYAELLFNQIWRNLGGSLTGQILPGLKKKSDTLLLKHSSKPLTEILTKTNKFSNNAMARQVFLTLGSKQKKSAITASDAEQEIKYWLETIGVPKSDVTIDNGSGLSRTSRISVKNIAKILERAWQSPLMPEFVSSLPLLATDGTLRKRMINSHLVGMGHLKTGYIKNVRTIAGFLRNKNNQTVMLVFFINHPEAKKSWPAHEELLKLLFRLP